MIIKSFSVCGISVAIDGSEDSEIQIKDLEDYSIGSDDSAETDIYQLAFISLISIHIMVNI